MILHRPTVLAIWITQPDNLAAKTGAAGRNLYLGLAFICEPKPRRRISTRLPNDRKKRQTRNHHNPTPHTNALP